MIQFGSDSEQSISVTDDGRFDLKKALLSKPGSTFLHLTNHPIPEEGWRQKVGSFSFKLSEKPGLDNDEMRFSRVPIVTTDDKQLDYVQSTQALRKIFWVKLFTYYLTTFGQRQNVLIVDLQNHKTVHRTDS